MLFWLAKKLTFSSQTSPAIKFMLVLSMVSIALTCGALALSWSIMRGLEIATLSNLQTIYPPYLMESKTGAPLNWPAIQQVLAHEFPMVTSAPRITKQLLLATETNQISPALTILGIDPELELLVSNLNAQVITRLSIRSSSHSQASHKAAPGTAGYLGEGVKSQQNLAILKQATQANPAPILIGADLAQTYNLKPGDQIELLIPAPAQKTNFTRTLPFELYTARVGALFKTGMSDFDQNLIICNLKFLQELFPDSQVTQVGLKLNCTNSKFAGAKPVTSNISNLTNLPPAQLLTKLQQRFKLAIYPWQELYAPLLAALQLEKTVMGLILLLITLITSCMIIALIFMLITQRRHEIALLQLLGVTPRQIRQLFILIGLSIVALASSFGLSLAALVGYLLRQYPVVNLPDIYLINTLPVQLELTVFLTIFGLSLILGLIAAWYPTRQLKYLELAQILKQRS